MTDIEGAHIIITGNPVDGFLFHGPTPFELGPGPYGFVRSIEDNGDAWTLAQLRPLPRVADARMALGTVDAAAGREPAVYFTLHRRGGEQDSSFGFVGNELVEAYDRKLDGTPDWVNGAICDEVRGDADFFYPAVALLRFWDSIANDVPMWHYIARQRVEEALTGFVELGLIAGHRTHEGSGGIAVLAHNSDDEHVLRTPAEGDAFCAALTAVSTSKVIAADRS